MKKIVMMSVFALLNAALVFAQEYKTKLPNSKERKFTIEISGSDIKVEGHNSDEVIIQVLGSFESVPARAKGLKPLYYTLEDNTGIGLAITPDNGGWKIEKTTKRDIKYMIRLPNKVAILCQPAKWQWQGNNIFISNMAGDLEVKTNGGNIDLIHVTGPVVANTDTGQITVVYSALNQEKPSAILNQGGNIDITLPANTKTSLNLRSYAGEVYTDFNLGGKNAQKGMSKVKAGNQIEDTINGGGVEMRLTTLHSKIYIRKQK